MRQRFWLLLSLGTVVFLGSVAAVMLALDLGEPWLARVAVVGMAVSAVLFLAAAFRPNRKLDWRRIQAEQRLWESGPLGRKWLRIRQRLSNLWKL